MSFTAAITQHPLTGDMVAFITEQECNARKVGDTLMNKILAQQFDMVAYLVDGTYGVTIGEAARIKHGSIFPTSLNGSYQNYLDTQVRPVLQGTEQQKDEAAKSLSLETIERELKQREPYVANIAIEMGGETYYKQFDFFSIDPEARFYILLKSDNTEIQKEQIALNEQLRIALDAANQANVAKTAFLSSMSHEIRKIIGDETAVIVLTAYNWDEVEQEAREAGVDSFMQKPLFASNVVTAFEQGMQGKQQYTEEKEAADLTGRLILVAEDMSINAEILQMTLEMQDVQSEIAQNGQIALEMFKSHPAGYYDAILMDMRMPVMDGLTATAEIRRCGTDDAKTIPIIALTANAFDEDVQRSLQAGMNAHLSKPIETDKLFATLGSLIR